MQPSQFLRRLPAHRAPTLSVPIPPNYHPPVSDVSLASPDGDAAGVSVPLPTYLPSLRHLYAPTVGTYWTPGCTIPIPSSARDPALGDAHAFSAVSGELGHVSVSAESFWASLAGPPRAP
eukprot:gene12265-2238_t